jgi:hypothetical protein
MTKKRYKKLMYALMQKAHGGFIKFQYAGCIFKSVQKIEFKDIKFNSYAEAWDSLKNIRNLYGM